MNLPLRVAVFTAHVDTQPCTDSYPELEDSSPAETFTGDSVEVYGVYSECDEGKRLLSGRPGHLTQCVGGAWTPQHDVCDEGKTFSFQAGEAVHQQQDCQEVIYMAKFRLI